MHNITSFIFNVPTQSNTSVTVNKFVFTPHNHLKSIVYVRVHSWFYNVEVGQYIDCNTV